MSLSRLPPELILIVGSYLSTSKELLNLMLVGPTFHNLVISQLYRVNVQADGGSALIWYARQGLEVGLRRMLAAGANVNLRGPDKQLYTPLMVAVSNKHIKIVQILLEHGALPDATNIGSNRALVIATSCGSPIRIAQLLLEHGANANAIEGDKHGPLYEAIRSKQVHKVALLLKYGAEIRYSCNRKPVFLLHVAAATNVTPNCLDLLTDAGILIDSQDDRSMTPLHIAANTSSTRAVRRLLQLGADPNLRNTDADGNGWSAIFYAAVPKRPKFNNKSIIKALVTYGAVVNCTCVDQSTPLHLAIAHGASHAARALVDCGADITARNAHGETVLHIAVLAGTEYNDLVPWLVELGADVNWTDGKKNETPIFYAVRGFFHPQSLEKVKQLIFHGANLHLKNLGGLTPLALAARSCYPGIIRVLLEQGASTKSRDIHGNSPLHNALELHHVNVKNVYHVVVLLIEHGADVNSRNELGQTPLHVAAAKNWAISPLWEVAKALMIAGADPNATAVNGKSPRAMTPTGICASAQRIFLH